MNKFRKVCVRAKGSVRKHARKVGAAVATGVAFAPGLASATGTGLDTTAITAAIADAQTKGVAIAGGVTLMIFMFAAAKWLRRAK